MTISIIDVFEVVEVKDCDREWMTVSFRPFKFLMCVLEKITPIIGLTEFVSIREQSQALLRYIEAVDKFIAVVGEKWGNDRRDNGSNGDAR